MQGDEWDATLQLRVQTHEAELQKHADSLEKLQSKHDAANLAYDGGQTELAPLEREIEQLEHYLTHNRTERANCEMRLSRAVATARSLQRGVLEGKCPTAATLAVKKQINSERTKAQEEEATAQGELQVLKQAGEDLNRQLLPLTQARERFRDQVTRSRMALDLLPPALADLNAKIKRITDERKESGAALNPFGQQLEDLRRRREQLAAEHKRHKEQLQADGEKLDRLLFWVEGFKDVKLSIIEEVLQEQELCTNAKLEQFGLIGWSTQYAPERETKSGGVVRGIDVRIVSPQTPERAVPFQDLLGRRGAALAHRRGAGAGRSAPQSRGRRADAGSARRALGTLVAAGRAGHGGLSTDRARELGRIIFLVDQTIIESAKFAATLTVVRDAVGTRIDVG